MNADVSSASQSVLRAARFNPLATVGLCFITIFVFFALLAPWIAPYDPAFIDLPHRLAPPSAQHWFGTDELGRDILSRIIFGARISMLVGASVVAGSLALGLMIGSLAGYYGGRIDRFVNVIVMNAFLSFPGFLAGDCICRVCWTRNFQSDSGAGDWRLGRLCATGARASARRARARVCRSGTGARRVGSCVS